MAASPSLSDMSETLDDEVSTQRATVAVMSVL